MSRFTINSASTDLYPRYNHNTFFNQEAVKQQINSDRLDTALLNAALFHCTNHQRANHNLKLFQFHWVLEDMAMLHSSQMCIHNFFGHQNNHNRAFKDLADRNRAISKANVFLSLGENIADYPLLNSGKDSYIIKNERSTIKYYTVNGLREIFPCTYEQFAYSILNSWMDSDGHRRNILNEDFLYLGCGVVMYEGKDSSSNPMVYFKCTQNFAGHSLVSVNKERKTFRIRKHLIK